jgi:hypothetical protein
MWARALPEPRANTVTSLLERIRRLPRWPLLTASLWIAACASRPQSPVLSQVAQVRTSPAAAEAETWAPQAHARARALEQQADAASSHGDSALAGLLAEHAIAAYEHAFVLTRLARAERRRLDAEAELRDQRRALGELQAQHQRLNAEAAGLELQAQAARGSLVLPEQALAAPERQRARRRAAAALATQGRLLCVATRLLGDADGVRDAIGRLDQLDRDLESGAPHVLSAATQLRAECLRLLSNVRRPHTLAVVDSGRGEPPREQARPPRPPASVRPVAAGPSASAPLEAVTPDLVLGELSQLGAMPSRDERGVSVLLRGLFDPRGQLTPVGRSQLAPLIQVAKAHPDFPLMLVAHSGSALAAPENDRRLAALAEELTRSGLAHVEVQNAGQRQPLLPQQAPSARERNERIELVFVAPRL